MRHAPFSLACRSNSIRSTQIQLLVVTFTQHINSPSWCVCYPLKVLFCVCCGYFPSFPSSPHVSCYKCTIQAGMYDCLRLPPLPSSTPSFRAAFIWDVNKTGWWMKIKVREKWKMSKIANNVNGTGRTLPPLFAWLRRCHGRLFENILNIKSIRMPK